MKTIIYPPTIDFNWLYQRPQQLLNAVSNLGYRVVFYNHNSYIKQEKRIVHINNNFILCTPHVNFEELGIQGQSILWISYPPNVALCGKFKENLVVFDAIDAPSNEFANWETGIPELQKKSDIIFSTSEDLYKYHKKHHKNVHICRNGADYIHFSKAQKRFSKKPPDLPNNNKPIIGYFGAISSWLDWNLIEFITDKNPEFNFIFIGPLYGNFRNILKRQNIYYLGRKTYEMLPHYLQYFNVCIIPFLITPMTRACNPVKLYEYLSAGKPVIGSNLPELSACSNVYIGKDHADFNKKIHEALTNNTHSKIRSRMLFAVENSWDNRAKLISGIIEKAFH